MYMSRTSPVTLGFLHHGLVSKLRCIPLAVRGVIQLLFVPYGASGSLLSQADLVLVRFFYMSFIITLLFRLGHPLRDLVGLPFLGLFGM